MYLGKTSASPTSISDAWTTVTCMTLFYSFKNAVAMKNINKIVSV